MALPPSFLLLLLLLGPAHVIVSAETTGNLEYKLPTPKYETEEEISRAERTLRSLTWLPQTFLNLVVPHSFPQDILREVLQNNFEFGPNLGMIIVYELGILICAVVGLLFIILMPLVGFCFCMCRCCGKCGGKMHQREKTQGPCLRRYFAVSLLVISILMSFGIICAFMANYYLRNMTTNAWRLADSNIKDLRTFLNITPEQINYVVDQYTPTKERAFSDLDNIKSLLGGRIHEALKPKVLPVLGNVRTMAEVIRRIKEGLTSVNKNLIQLKTSTRQLSHNLSIIQDNLKQIIQRHCSNQPSCESIRLSLSDLNDTSTVAQLPSLDDKINSIDNVDKIDLLSLVKKGNAAFNDIPKMIQNQTKHLIPDLKQKLNSTGSKLDNINKNLPIKNLTEMFSKHIDNFENSIDPYFLLVEKYDLYRWVIALVLCFLLTLIVTFYFLGLLCGTVGYNKRATPTTRGCISNTGGIFLMVGVGLSFLVCWIVMVFVLLTFVLGGNVEKLVCEPYQNRKLFQILDTPYLLNNQWKYYLSGLVLDDPEVALTFEETYNHCKENRGIYATLKLDQKYNISNKLNIETLTSTINQEFDKMNIDLSKVVVLDEEGKQGLRDFNAIKAYQINYDAFLTEINKPPTKGDLLLFADKVERGANNLSEEQGKQNLLKEAYDIRYIHKKNFLPLQQLMSNTNRSLWELQETTSNLEDRVNSLIFNLDSVQDFITTNTSSIIRKESKKYMNSIISYFEHYLEWVRRSITEEVASCKPMAIALDSTIEVLLCSYIIDPINLFWFGLGKATFLLFPALIFAIKLAKYYRRMQSEDVYYEYSGRGSVAAAGIGKETS